MDLNQSNHGIIVVTDHVIVATWYAVIIVAQLKEDIQHHCKRETNVVAVIRC